MDHRTLPPEDYQEPVCSFCTDAWTRRENDPLFPDYLARIAHALEQTVAGISWSGDPADQARAEYFRSALDEISALERCVRPEKGVSNG